MKNLNLEVMEREGRVGAGILGGMVGNVAHPTSADCRC